MTEPQDAVGEGPAPEEGGEEQAATSNSRFIEVRDMVPEPDPDPQLNGNVMAAVWPKPEGDREVFARLVRRPDKREPDFLDHPLALRLEYLDRLDRFHYPFASEISAFRQLVSLIRKSYIPRDPRMPEVYQACLDSAAGRYRSVPRLSETGGGGALGMLLTGITGGGKTSFLDRFCAALVRSTRRHWYLRGKPCRWLQLGPIRVKVKSTWKATLQAIIAAIDFWMHTDYYSKREASSTRPRYETTVLAALTNSFAPILILEDIEEIQRFGKDAAEILSGLISVMEQAGIVVMVVGTVAVERIMKSYRMEFSKLAPSGAFTFPWLHENDADSQRYVSALLKQSVSKSPLQMSDDFTNALMVHTMGNRRICREFVRAVLRRHANDERTVLNKDLLKSVEANELTNYKESLAILRQVALGIDLPFDRHVDYEHSLPPDRPTLSPEESNMMRQMAAKKFGKLPEQLGLEVFSADLFDEWRRNIEEARRIAREQKDSPAAQAVIGTTEREAGPTETEAKPVANGTEVSAPEAAPLRKRGRPAGSKNKPKAKEAGASEVQVLKASDIE